MVKAMIPDRRRSFDSAGIDFAKAAGLYHVTTVLEQRCLCLIIDVVRRPLRIGFGHHRSSNETIAVNLTDFSLTGSPSVKLQGDAEVALILIRRYVCLFSIQ
jgi:hypothetical protein